MRPGAWTAAVLGALLGCAGEATPTGDASAHDAADVAINDLGMDGGIDPGTDSGVPRCVPGTSVACACESGASGTQVCNTAGLYNWCQCWDGGPGDVPVYAPIGGPRLILPRSVSRSMTQRPTFRWVLPDGVTRARVTVARNRALTNGVRSGEAEGTSWRPTEPLPFGVWFWRVEGLGRDGGVVWTSPTWEFRAPRRDSGVDSSWGKFRDFNGDGYDDLVVVLERGIEIYHGSPTGIAATPTVALAFPPFTIPSPESGRFYWYSSDHVWGDLNGDGLTDLVYRISEVDLDGLLEALGVRVAIHWGTPTGLAASPDLLLDEYGERGSATGVFYEDLTIGDWDGDGIDDLLTNVRGYGRSYDPPVPRRVLLLRGSPEGRSLARRGEPTIDGFDGFDGLVFLGAFMIQDIDLDGRADLTIPLYQDGEYRNEQVLRGFAPPRPIVRLDSRRCQFNGDLDGDGYVECLQWSPNHLTISRTDGLPDRRLARVVILSVPDIPNSGGPDGAFGAVLDCGDTNGDGQADLIIGAPGAGSGRVYLYTGGPAGVVQASRWDGRAGTGENFGYYLHAQDDLNGDGFDDVATGTLSERRLEIRHGASDPSAVRLVFERRISSLRGL